MQRRITGIAILMLVASGCGLWACACHRQQETPAASSPVAAASASPRVAETPKSPPQPLSLQQPNMAGQFYPGDPAKLSALVDAYIDSGMDTPVKGDIWGLMAPHAGYPYSGPIAGSAYRAVRGKSYSLVVVMAFKHQPFDPMGNLLFSGVGARDVDAFATPLGNVPVARKDVQAIIKASGGLVADIPALFTAEHSLEVQLPFLQRSLQPGWKLLPLMFGQQSPDNARRLAKLLFARYGQRKDVLFVASTDMSHYFDYDTARTKDKATLRAITALDADALWRGMQDRSLEVCGPAPVSTLLYMALSYGDNEYPPTILDARNSGDTAAGKDRVVGYGAVAFATKPGVRTQTAVQSRSTGKETPMSDYRLSDSEKIYLLKYARNVVEAAVTGEAAPTTDGASDIMRRKGAAFVTLKEHGDLRGCIGHVVAHVPLIDCVASVGRAAALEDPRFPPVKPAELKNIDLEVSVLTPIEPCADVNSVQVGVHGLMMKRGYHQGLLLPQVPEEYGWNRTQFLQQTCRKAGMEASCYTDPKTEIFTFTAIVFNEHDFGLGPDKR